MDLPTIRIFISSPGDVNEERLLVARVIERLAMEFAGRTKLDPIFWEHEPLLASDSFQAQITSPSQCHIVVCILWSRLGSRLPPNFVRSDQSRYASGTEYEFEDAIRGFKRSGRPALIVYRKTAAPIVSVKNRTERGNQWQQMEALDGFLDKWFHHSDDKSLIGAFHEFERPADFEERVEVHLRKLIEDQAADAVPAQQAPERTVTWTHGSPFRGLRVFDLRHASVFFGRTRAVSDVLTSLRQQAAAGRAFVLVLGMSGIGKSSLVRAGVLPMLLQPGVMEGIGVVRWALIRPSDESGQLLKALVGALLQAEALPELIDESLSRDQLTQAIGQDAASIDVYIKRALSRLSSNLPAEAGSAARLVLIVDQLEELFSHAEITRERRQAFIALLAAMARSGRVWIMATMRADLFHRSTEEPELLSLIEGGGQYLLAPPTPAEIGQIIRLPALAAGLRFDTDVATGESLDEVLRHAATRTPENVPLLEFTMEELFQRRTPDNVLTFAAYREIGEIEGALAQRAESIYCNLPPESQQALPPLLRALVTMNVGKQDAIAAKRVALNELPTDPARQAAMTALTDARLLLTDGGTGHTATIRIAHEALLSHWPRLHGWLEEDREFIRSRERITQSQEIWLAENRLDVWLLDEGKPLADGEALLRRSSELEPDLIEYIDASIATARSKRAAAALAARNKVRRARRLALGFGVLTVVAIAGAVAGYAGRLEALRQTAVAQEHSTVALRTQSLFLADLAQQQIEAGNSSNAILLALNALPHDPLHPTRPYVAEVEQALYRAVQTEQEVAVLSGHHGWVTGVDFSPDGKRLATASADGTVRIWDVATGHRTQVVINHDDAVNSVRFDTTGERIVSASSDGSARIWDAVHGKPLSILLGHDKPVNAAVFNPNGTRVATAAADGTVRLWDPATGKTIRTLVAGTQSVQDVAFSYDGERLLTVSSDTSVRLWRVNNGALVTSFPGHQKDVQSAAFSLDDKRVLTASLDGTARVWDSMTGRMITALPGYNGGVNSARFAPVASMNLIATAGSDATLRLWNATQSNSLGTLRGHERGILAVTFSRDGHYLATGSQDATARIWTTYHTGQYNEFIGHRYGVLTGAVSPDGNYIATGSMDTTARLWDRRTRQQVREFSGHSDSVTHVAFDPEGRFLASTSNDGTIRLWSTYEGTNLAVLNGHEGTVSSVGFSPDGKLLVSGGHDGSIRIWDRASAREISRLSGHENWVLDVAFSPDGTRIASASRDRTARLWDVSNGKPLSVLAEHTASVYSVDFSRDGKRLVTASADRTARVWDTASAKPLVVLSGEKQFILDAAFTADAMRVATGSADSTVSLWDTNTGKRLAVFKGHGKDVTSVTFGPDNQTLLSTSTDATARLWRVYPTTQALMTAAIQLVPRELTDTQRHQFFLTTE